MKRITVVGGGGTGLMMAADLSLKGHEVTLFELKPYAEKIEAVRQRGYVEVTVDNVTKQAVISRITTEKKEALAFAECILIAVMAQRQEEIMDEIAPFLQEGQTVCFSAGNCASILLKKKLGGKNILVGEMQGNIYPCRLLPDGKLISAFPYKKKGVAAFPARDNEAFVEALAPVYPCYPVRNVFEATLNSPNVSIHLAGTLLGTTKLETTRDFRLYRDGLCPSVARLIQTLEDEKANVMVHMGYDVVRSLGQIQALMEYDQHPELDVFRSLEGPTGVDHRYVTEDAYTGNSLLLSMAMAFGIDTPVLAGLVAIASALNQTDFYSRGRTLEYFGLKGLGPDAVNHYLETGDK